VNMKSLKVAIISKTFNPATSQLVKQHIELALLCYYYQRRFL